MSDIYKRSNLTTEYHVKSFVLHYKKYFDTALIKSNEAQFNKNLDTVRAEIQKIGDIKKNILFISNADINKYVFLSCFTLLDRLVSNRYMNIMNLIDVWNHNSTSENFRLDSEEVFYSEQDIREDVFCLYIDNFMITNRMTGSLINTVLSSRTDRHNKKGENLLSWIFYRGTSEELNNNSNLYSIYNLFNRDKDKYKIVDLHNLDKMFGSSKPSNTTNPTSLDDLY